jgi:hypothetical protein
MVIDRYSEIGDERMERFYYTVSKYANTPENI